MIDKSRSSVQESMSGIKDGTTIMIGDFVTAGQQPDAISRRPQNPTDCLALYFLSDLCKSNT